MKKRICAAVLASLAMLFSTASPVFAIANPNSITLHTAKAFENIWETGDMLFVVSYDVNYTSEPSESAETTFLTTLLAADGTTLLMSRALNYYQYNLISIYATAAQVISLGLTWSSDYRLRVTGNPALFSTLTEGTNMRTVTLSASDWNADGTLTSKELLKLHCIDIAETLEADWAVVLLVTTSTGEQVLNSTGTVTFLDAIPGLQNAIPNLFQLSSSVLTITPKVSGADYAVNSQIDARLGSNIGNAFTGIGTFLGIGQNSAAGLWAIIFLLTIASIVFLSTGNSTAALILAVPIIVLMTYLGAIPDAVTYVGAIFVAVYAMYFFWLRGT